MQKIEDENRRTYNNNTHPAPKLIEEDKRRKFKITLGGKRIHERTKNNNARSAPQINIPNIVMENVYNPPNIPMIPGVRNNEILECCKPLEKKLFNSDLDAGQGRLLLNKNHVETYFLPLLKKGEEDVRQGINVVVYDMQGKTFNMVFKNWSEKVYVLTGKGWIDFFKTRQMKEIQDHVTVWMFRHSETNELCFALSVRRVQN